MLSFLNLALMMITRFLGGNLKAALWPLNEG